MNFLKKYNDWLNKRVKILSWQDIGLIKLSVMMTTLILVKFFPSLLNLELKYYVILFLIFTFYPVKKFYFDK